MDHNISNNDLDEMKGNLEVTALDTEKEAAVVEEAAAAEEPEEVKEFMKADKYAVAVVDTEVEMEDEEIHEVKEVAVININGNIKARYISSIVFIANQTLENIQWGYIVVRCYHAYYVDGTKHTQQRITPQ